LGALPSPSHHQTKVSLPCCIRICPETGGTSGAALRVRKDASRRPVGEGGALEE
jgi:hypothetical protein